MATVKFGNYVIKDNTTIQIISLVLKGHGEANAELYKTINDIIADGYKSVREIYYKKIHPDGDYTDDVRQRMLLENYIRFANVEVEEGEQGYTFIFNVDEFVDKEKKNYNRDRYSTIIPYS